MEFSVVIKDGKKLFMGTRGECINFITSKTTGNISDYIIMLNSEWKRRKNVI